ncbi:MAG: hypothetical protein NZ530_07780 [Thermodesulfobacteriaceae bacterium]|nr:hypothetical protein [Thermodesulfobacteriaceae bacterium]MCX8041381.1 hypothetical protein [Thermodesulfobacteriaceae bacterium]MDW8136150.1 hypothetical protein [Thermodesulfobacterium sp.]
MKIEIEGQIVKLIPENLQEAQELNKLWQLLVTCVQEDKRIRPLGIYVPGSTEEAKFLIEEVKVSSVSGIPKRYGCIKCGTIVEVAPNDPTPICCGEVMKLAD